MAHHVAPAELAPELKMSEQELVAFCLDESIPILHGMVDRTLVEAQIRANSQERSQHSAAGAATA